MKKKKIINNEEGFTLIEVIAVLIILGILAAVAVPKYFDLSEEASKKAAEGAVAEGLSLCTLAYSKIVLQMGKSPASVVDPVDPLATPTVTILSEVNDAAEDVEGDFDLTFTPTNGNAAIIVRAESNDSSSLDSNFAWAEKTWVMPAP